MHREPARALSSRKGRLHSLLAMKSLHSSYGFKSHMFPQTHVLNTCLLSGGTILGQCFSTCGSWSLHSLLAMVQDLGAGGSPRGWSPPCWTAGLTFRCSKATCYMPAASRVARTELILRNRGRVRHCTWQVVFPVYLYKCLIQLIPSEGHSLVGRATSTLHLPSSSEKTRWAFSKIYPQVLKLSFCVFFIFHLCSF